MRKLKVSSVRRIGKKQTYNLHMQEDHHNFLLANGVVSGNSHALAYSVITYWTAYLKAHFPVEFYAALLACETKPDRIIQYAGSAKDYGIEILPPDVNRSGVLHQPEGRAIRFGLSHIKGMPKVTAEEIIRIRDQG